MNVNLIKHTPSIYANLYHLLAPTQDESGSISENSTWGIRRRFEQGKVSINEKKFLGYEKDEEDNLIINDKQAKIVRHIYKAYLDGKGTNKSYKKIK